jgi:hypothetical protein
MAPKPKGKGKATAAPAAAAGGAAVATGQATEPPTDPMETEETEEEEENGTEPKTMREGADVSKVTDFFEQKELDSAKASKALASIAAEDTVDREAEREREKELAAVQIEQVGLRYNAAASEHGARCGTLPCSGAPAYLQAHALARGRRMSI